MNPPIQRRRAILVSSLILSLFLSLPQPALARGGGGGHGGGGHGHSRGVHHGGGGRSGGFGPRTQYSLAQINAPVLAPDQLPEARLHQFLASHLPHLLTRHH